MMFGTRDEFDYFLCLSCGCLQIAVVPDDLAKYYSNGYYSFTEPTTLNFLKRYLKRKRSLYGLGTKSILGKLAARKYPLSEVYDWARRAGLNHASRILDVGCGKGFFLLKLEEEGFTDLTGIDPYLDSDITSGKSVRIYKKAIRDLEGEWDFVMLNHSFEHMSEPFSVLSDVFRLLKLNGYALIRIPVMPSHAWRTYGVNWVQLDAPRHLFLHSVQSIRLLAEKTGFELTEIVYDSEDLQFWGSELYSRDISMAEYDKSVKANPENSLFSPSDLAQLKEKAAELNREEQGDQACFYLRKPHTAAA